MKQETYGGIAAELATWHAGLKCAPVPPCYWQRYTRRPGQPCTEATLIAALCGFVHYATARHIALSIAAYDRYTRARGGPCYTTVKRHLGGWRDVLAIIREHYPTAASSA